MYIDSSKKRKSGISLLGDISWGTSFCQFYQTRKEMLDILGSYFKAGLENNEFCVWITSDNPVKENPEQLLKETLPDFEQYIRKGQLEIVPKRRWTARNQSEKSILSRLDRAVLFNFEGVRLAFDLSPDDNNGIPSISKRESQAINRHNVIATFAYPRDNFDASGLMEVVKNHQYALIRNSGKWEVLESSQARIAGDALNSSQEKLRALFSHMAEGFAYHRIVLDESGKPCDYIFLEVNKAFEKLAGLKAKNILGQRVTRVLPGIEKDTTNWIGRYGRVALTGKPAHFESYSQVLKKWYSVSAFSPNKGFFAVTFNDITTRKSYENAILKAKTEWERTFNSDPDLIAILDNQHQVIRANKAMADRLRVTPDQCVGLHCYEVVHGVSQPPGFCPHTLTCDDRQEHTAEVHESRLGGDFLVSTSPIYDDRGELTGSIHIARDITERKRAEKDLLRLNRELRALNDCNQAIVRSNDESTLFTDVCRIMCDVVGYRMAWVGTLEQDEAKSIRPVAWYGNDNGYIREAKVTWADTEFGRGPTGVAARTGRTDFCQDFITESRASVWRRAALERGFRSSIALPLFDNQDSVFAVFTLYATEPYGFTPEEIKLLEELAGDLAFGIRALRMKQESTRSEETLKVNNARLRILSEAGSLLLSSDTPESIIRTIAHGVMEHLDCDFFFNFIADEKAGKLRLNAFSGISAEIAKGIEWLNYGEAICGCAARDGYRVVVENIQENNDTRAALVRSLGVQAYAAHPLKSGTKTIGTLSFGTRSRCKFTEDELGLMKTVAGQVSIALERKWSEESLKQRTRELEAANKELESFSYTVSHDLRAPLRSLDGYSQALLEDYSRRLDEQGKRWLENIRTSSQHMGHLIDDILGLSRVVRTELKLEKVNLSEIACSLATKLKQTEPLRQVEFNIMPGAEDLGDANLLELVLQNLLGNAFKFTAARSPGYIEFGLNQRDGKTVYFVRDNGPGFDMKYVNMLFQPFQRLHSEREFAGTGIGLVTAQRIVRKHGGEIWAEGEINKGATFYFTLNQEGQ